MFERWNIISEDGNGKIHILSVLTDNPDPIVTKVQSHSPFRNVLAVYRTRDIVEFATT